MVWDTARRERGEELVMCRVLPSAIHKLELQTHTTAAELVMAFSVISRAHFNARPDLGQPARPVRSATPSTCRDTSRAFVR